MVQQDSIVQITDFGRSSFEKIVKNFKCDKHRELVEYIKRYAYKHSKSNLYKTYISLNENKEPVGYISFSLSDIGNKEKFKNELGISTSILYPIPALKITRLLVSDEFQGKKYGTSLLFLADILAFVVAYQIGCKLILVDAKNDAKNFYSKNTFKALRINKENDTTLMFKKVNEDLLDFYIDFCNSFNLKSLELYLNSIKKNDIITSKKYKND